MTHIKKPLHMKAQKHFPIYSKLPEDNTHKVYEDRSVKQDHTQHCKQCDSTCALDNKAKLRGKPLSRGRDGIIFHSFLLNKVLCGGFQGKKSG